MAGKRSASARSITAEKLNSAKSKPKQDAEDQEEVELDSNAESDEEESSDGEPIVTMFEGREKRYNAGNRMRALLDEESSLQVEEEFKEEVNDDEFVGKG
jgi:hypothetical protein